MTTEAINIKIDRYLSGEMEGQELQEFKAQLAEDDELAEKVAEAVVAHHSRLELKNKLKEYENSMRASGSSSMSGRMLLKVAAAIVIVILPVYYLYFNNNPSSLHDQYFEPYRSPSVVRGESQDDWAVSGELYGKGKYGHVIEKLSSIDTVVTAENYLQHFYLGVSYMAAEKKEYKNAIIHLEKVLDIDNDYHNQAKWYLAIAYYYTNKKEESKALLQYLEEEDTGNISTKAKEVLATYF